MTIHIFTIYNLFKINLTPNDLVYAIESGALNSVKLLIRHGIGVTDSMIERLISISFNYRILNTHMS